MSSSSTRKRSSNVTRRRKLLVGMTPYMIRTNSLWGNIANIPVDFDEERVNILGFNGAMREYQQMRKMSPHRASSGQSEEMTRGPRKEHYRRKGILEAEKEKTRRQRWQKMYPGRGESNWQHRENLRRVRKENEKRTRKHKRSQ